MIRSDEVFRDVGLTLGVIQFADNCMRSALKTAFPGASSITLEVLDRNQKELEKATLGKLIKVLSERVELDPDFESTLRSYCADRNAFVHEWDRIPSWNDDASARKFMISLQKRAAWLVCVFTELLRQWCEQEDIAPEAMMEAEEAGVFDAINGPWLKNLDLMFKKVKETE